MKSTKKTLRELFENDNYLVVSKMIGDEQTKMKFTNSDIKFYYNGKWLVNPFVTLEGKSLSYADAMSYYGINSLNNFISTVKDMLTKMLKRGFLLETARDVVRGLRFMKEAELSEEEGREMDSDSIIKDYPEFSHLIGSKVM